MDLEIPQGEFFVLLGPSGAGKTTLVNVLCGLLEPDSGIIRIGDRTVVSDDEFLPPRVRGMSVVMQDGGMWQNMTVRKHIEFVMEDRFEQDTFEERVARALELVRLSGFENRLPSQLSGGERQRLAVARAIAAGNSVLLLDEPFGSLDRPLAFKLMDDLVRIQRTVGLTVLLVTHQQEEALFMADRIGIMNEGRIVQLSDPPGIYLRPKNYFTARFFGDSNCLPLKRENSELTCELGSFEIPPGAQDNRQFVLCFRPVSLAVNREGKGVESKLLSSVFKGEYYLGTLRTEGGTELVANFGSEPPKPGSYYVELAGPRVIIPKD
ncbi:MAG: ABC transporter ATP-binding protein [Planctomycetota bacterium]|nr:ABC transporter ATP-binding protein [Planctomycetota bacterium]